MKLKKLEIENIASFAHQEIDFGAPPLLDADLFLINGETGSGKSTILDAVCLALYGDTPRLDTAQRQAEKEDMPENLSYNDPRRMLRLNAGSGFVKLRFEVAGEEWEAEWSVRRARNKPEGQLQKKSWSLTNLSTKSVLRKDNDISAKITELIGLDFTQFCRTTMLSQGEFAAFLKSRPEEKAEILRKITGVDKFRRIGKMIFTIFSEKKKTLQEVKEKKETLEKETLSSEHKRELEEAQSKHKQSRNQAKADKIRLQHGKEWWRCAEESQSRMVSTRKELTEAEKSWQTEEMRQLAADMALYDKTGDIRAAYLALAKGEKDEVAAKEELNGLRTEFSRLAGCVAALCEKKKTLDMELKELAEKVESKESLKEIFSNASEIILGCSNVSGWRDEVAEKGKELKNKEKELDEVIYPCITAVAEELKGIEKTHKELTAQLEAKNEALQQCDLSAKRKAAEALRKEKERYGELRVLLTNLEKNSGAIQKMLAEQSGIEQIIAATQADLVKAREEEISKKSAFDTQQSAFDSAQMAAGKSAAHIRAMLKKGSKCPVCGNVLESEPQSDKLLRRLAQEAKEKLQQLQTEYENVVKKVSIYTNTLELKEKELAKCKSNLEEEKEQKETFEAELEAKCKELLIDFQEDSAMKEYCDTHIAGLNEKISELTAEITAGEKLDADVKKHTAQLAKKQKELDKANKKKQQREKRKTDEEREVSVLKTAIAALNKNIDVAIERLSAAVEGKEISKYDFTTHPAEFASDLKELKNEYEEQKTKAGQLTDTLKALAESISRSEEKKTGIITANPSWTDVEADKIEHAEAIAIEKELGILAGKVIVVTSNMRKAVADKKQQQQVIADFISNNPEIDSEQVKRLSFMKDKEVSAMRKQVQDADNLVVRLSDNLTRQQQEHEAVLEQQPDWLDVENKASSEAGADAEKESETNREPQPEKIILAELDDKITDAENRFTEAERQLALIQAEYDNSAKKTEELDAVIKQYGEAEKEYNRWNNLNSLLGDAEGKRFSNIALSHLLGNLIHDANTYMQQLNDRYRLDVIPGTFSIMVCDKYQGYSKRTANTISGGETFLVSLALALALSNIGELSGCDILFIDEGFGSLSGGPLDKAVNTLKNLHRRDGRRIGIISHITELREKIPTQIIVERTMSAPATVRITP